MDDGEWVSYSELAQRRGIDRDSASRLAVRHRWRRRKGNDGRAHVLVPADYLNPAAVDSPPDSPPDNPPDSPLGMSPRHVAVLEAAIAALEAAQKATLEALERERRRVDATEARAEADRAAAAEREAAAQARADRAEQRADRIEAAAAQRAPLAWRDVLAWFRKRGR